MGCSCSGLSRGMPKPKGNIQNDMDDSDMDDDLPVQIAEARINILGLENSGKTAIFNSLIDSEEDYTGLKPTKGIKQKLV